MMHMKTNREGRGPVQPFSGGIADVRIWSSALPDAEMSSVYRQFVGDAVDPEGYVSGGFSHTVSYEQNRDLVSAVTNRFGSRVISAFGYSNGTAGRRTAISRSGEAFGDLSGAKSSPPGAPRTARQSGVSTRIFPTTPSATA